MTSQELLYNEMNMIHLILNSINADFKIRGIIFKKYKIIILKRKNLLNKKRSLEDDLNMLHSLFDEIKPEMYQLNYDKIKLLFFEEYLKMKEIWESPAYQFLTNNEY
jgi:hypothetical protein